MPFQSGPSSFGKFNVLAMVRKLIDSNVPILTLLGPPTDGTSGSFSDYPVDKGALLIDTENGDLYINEGELGEPAWNIIFHNTTGDGIQSARMFKLTFDASIDDKSFGSHPFTDSLGNPVLAPLGAILTFGVINTVEGLTGDGGDTFLSLQFEEVTFQTGTVVTGAPWIPGHFNTSELGSWADTSYVLSETTGEFSYRVSVAELATGKFDVFVYYLPSELP